MVPARLLTRLDRAAAGPAPVLLITAPAGSGKTALIAAWTEHLSRTRPGARTLRIPGDRAPEFLRHRNIHRLRDESGYGDTVLVIDDAHRLVTEDAIRAVEQFLRTAPPRLITVLAARRPPALAWHTLTSAARLTRFVAADLALDPTDAAAGGCPLTGAELALVHDLTRGWPTLVRLAATYLDAHREYRSAALTMLEHAPRPLAEFLTGEVLPALDDAERELLTTTRRLAEFTPDLADVLTGGRASAAIDRLEHAGFPLRRHLRDGILHYSYPPLLRGYLEHTARPVADAVWIDPSPRTPAAAAPPVQLDRRPQSSPCPASPPPGSPMAPSARRPAQAEAPPVAAQTEHTTGCPPPDKALRDWCRTHPSATVLPHLLAAPDRTHLVEFLSEHAVRLVLDANGPALFGPLEDARSPLLEDPALTLLYTADALVRGAHPSTLPNPLRRLSRILDAARLAALESAVAADLAVHADTAALHALALPARPRLTGHDAVDYYAELSLATAHALSGDTVLGERGLRRARALAEAMGAPRLRLRAQVRLAVTAVLAGRSSAARERAAHAMELAVRSGLTGTADHARAAAIRALHASRPADTETPQPADTPQPAEASQHAETQQRGESPPPAWTSQPEASPSAEFAQRTEAGAEVPRLAETGDSVLLRSVRRVVAESSR